MKVSGGRAQHLEQLTIFKPSPVGVWAGGHRLKPTLVAFLFVWLHRLVRERLMLLTTSLQEERSRTVPLSDAGTLPPGMPF